jgi:putative hydrolase of the HAD superfamily
MILKVNKQTTVVFDLDDTLYNELDYLKSSYQEIATYLDPENKSYLYALMFSKYRKQENVFQYLTQNYNISKNELIEKYRNHLPNITLFEHAEMLMQDIKEKEGKIAIITDGRSKTQRNKIKKLGIEEYIDLIIISEEIGSEKPSLKNFQMVETVLKTQNNIYIADNITKDFIAPNLLGWNSICLIDNGKNIHVNAEINYTNQNECPKYFIHNFNEIFIQISK